MKKTAIYTTKLALSIMLLSLYLLSCSPKSSNNSNSQAQQSMQMVEATFECGCDMMAKGRYDMAEIFFLEANIPSAWGNLGFMYMNGDVGSKDGQPNYQKAKEYFEKAAILPDSHYNLGVMYINGYIGCMNNKPDYQKAAKCFEKANTPAALLELGKMYKKGFVGHKSGQPNYQKAAEWFEKAGIPDAYYNLAIMYMKGQISRGKETPNYQKAKECFKRVNTPGAFLELGIMYKDGYVGCDSKGNRDYQKAQVYLKKAAKANISDAFHNLGIMYANGYIGCMDNKPNYQEAKECFEKANTPGALQEIGKLYMKGYVGYENGSPNYQQAEKYFKQAKTPDALYNLGIMYKKGYLGRDSKEIPNYQQAEEYFKQANAPDALYDLGVMYMNGNVGHENGQPDYQKAEECYQKANTPSAHYNLGVMYVNGYVGCVDNNPDYQKAQVYFEKAAEAKIPDAFHSLGIMCIKGQMSQNNNSGPDYQKAQVYFEKAGKSESFYIMGLLYELGRLNDTPYSEKALEYYSKSELAEAKVGILRLYVLDLLLSPSSPKQGKQILQQHLDGVNKLLSSLPYDKHYFYIKGLAEYYIGNWEDALVSLQYAQLFSSGEKDPILIHLIIQEINMHLEEEEKSKIKSHEESPLPQIPKMDESIGIQEQIPSSSLEKTVSFVKLTKEQKKARRAKIKRLDFLQDLNVTTASRSSVPNIEFEFLNATVKIQFEDLKQTDQRFNALLEDIKFHRYQANGIGKPEVLKYKYMGHYGCIARRLNHKDRIIYKPMEKGKMLILSVQGHYND